MKVDYIEHMGSDLTVVNAARVSFSKHSHWEVAGYDKEQVGDKEYVDGFTLYDLESEEIAFHLQDAKRGLLEEWLLPARRCQGTAGRNSPAFLATSYDLTH